MNNYEEPDTEVNIFHFMHLAAKNWLLLLALTAIGLAAGFLAYKKSSPEFSAKCVIKVFRQNINNPEHPFSVDKNDADHIARLEEDSLRDAIAASMDGDNPPAKISLSCQGQKQASGTLTITGKGTNQASLIVFLNRLLENYADYATNQLTTKNQRIIKALSEQCERLMTELAKQKKELDKFPANEQARFEAEKFTGSNDNMKVLLEKYDKTCQRAGNLEAEIAILEKDRDPEAIIDAFNAHCPRLAASNRTDAEEPIWSSVVEFRHKAERLMAIKERLDATNGADETLKKEFSHAEAELKRFSDLTMSQLKARLKRLRIDEAQLLRRIREVGDYQRKDAVERLQYHDLLTRYRSDLAAYETTRKAYHDRLGRGTDKYYIETLSRPELTGSNIIKRLAILIFPALMLLGMGMMWLVIFDGYRSYHQRGGK